MVNFKQHKLTVMRPGVMCADGGSCSVQRRVPITSWLPRYRTDDILPDLIAGVTVGLTLIPQSIAYASLAGLEPQSGLYSAFLGTFVYIIFGTVKEVNLGPKALLSLLTFNYTHRLGTEFAVLLCFLCGCFELICGALQLGFLIQFVSAPVISGFTWAAVVVIANSQLKGLLGLKFTSESLLQTWTGVIKNIAETRLGDVILGASCCVVLLGLKKLKEKMYTSDTKLIGRKKTLNEVIWFISTARNALVVLVSAIIASILEFYGGAPFYLTGRITAGLPPLQPPPFTTQNGNNTIEFPEMATELGPGVLVVSVVAIISNLAIGKAFAQGKMLDATQEMVALGLCNIAGSFVGSMPVAGAFSRSAISSASGVRTPLAGLYTGVMVLLSLSLLTPHFYYIPRATLAAVVACSVISLVDLSILKPMWQANKLDVVSCFVTFTAALVLSVDIGLLVGVLFDVLVILIFQARPKIQVQLVQDDVEYLLVKPSLGLLFPAADHVRSAAQKACDDNSSRKRVPLVLDCSTIAKIDFTAAQGLGSLCDELQKSDHKLLLLNARPDVLAVVNIVCAPRTIQHATSLSQLVTIIKEMRLTDENLLESVQVAVVVEHQDNGTNQNGLI